MALHSTLHGTDQKTLEPIFAHKLTSMGLCKQFGRQKTCPKIKFLVKKRKKYPKS